MRVSPTQADFDTTMLTKIVSCSDGSMIYLALGDRARELRQRADWFEKTPGYEEDRAKCLKEADACDELAKRWLESV